MNPTSKHDTLRNKRNTLQVPQAYDIIAVYLTHGNGGYDVNVRVPNSRGGSAKTEGIGGHCSATHQAKKACGLQNQRRVAYHTRRLAEFPGCPEEYQTRGKLSAAFLAVTQSRSIAWNPLNQDCKELLPCAHFVTNYHQSKGHTVAAASCALFTWKFGEK